MTLHYTRSQRIRQKENVFYNTTKATLISFGREHMGLSKRLQFTPSGNLFFYTKYDNIPCTYMTSNVSNH